MGSGGLHVVGGLRVPGAPVLVRAPAKVNLALRVGGLRPDGSHELVTVFEAVSLHEDVRASPSDGLECTVTGEGADDVPVDGRNLAVRAALLLAERAGVPAHVRLDITKEVPVAGGMAGGSADAAAALVACDALWGTGMSRDDLALLGAELGADVPFALLGGTAVGTGRGEQVLPALARGERSWVLALSATGLSTPAVYGELDRRRGEVGATEGAAAPDVDEEHVHDLLAALRGGDAAAVAAALVNDLQEPALALAPHLRRTLDVGLEAGALAGVVSGSGPTTAFLVDGREQGLAVAVALAASGAAADVRRVSGPVPGARVVEPAR
ncbi:4-(cytidine 5'-diphospho)-2-C-methyl-D-erythritol kinase [Pseudokineococcus basanitobsidens]|uniref:4-diphosphocytidyl-2-C-methyl-D-erythritol kinase n=1 Tax=Pseudokineococcus basanitobsidens TaxID=1926649 RepID=A0ABU8RMT0_9ACTN